jgi:hypothetical protein
VTATERYKRHGHYPGLILVEDNPALAARLERALFDDHFEVLHVSDDDVSASVLVSQFAVFESAGFLVIYSCAVLAPEAKRKLAARASDRFFDLSTLELPNEEREAMQKLLSVLHQLRALVDYKNQDKIK